jgi:predicted TIM-barrel fold metal-dependent hydrolase
LQDIGAGNNVLQTVFIECRSMYRMDGPPEWRPVGQTEFVQGIAAQAASGLFGKTLAAAGIVGYVDLALGQAVAPVIEAHLMAGRNRFRGIRNVLTWHASPDIQSRVNSRDFQANPKFREGFAYLRKYNLSFDTFVFHTQLSDLIPLARAFPDTPIILEHLGCPLGIGPYSGQREEVFREWRKGIADIAVCPNVIMKISGLGQLLNGFNWHERPVPPGSEELARTLSPYVDHCLETFGIGRCLFESNFPVDRVSFSYTVLWNAFKRLTKGFSAGERAALFHDNAVRVYRLTPGQT